MSSEIVEPAPVKPRRSLLPLALCILVVFILFGGWLGWQFWAELQSVRQAPAVQEALDTEGYAEPETGR